MTIKINHSITLLIAFLLSSNIVLAQTDKSLINVQENIVQETSSPVIGSDSAYGHSDPKDVKQSDNDIDSSTPGFSFAIQGQYGFIPAHNDDKTHNNTYSLDFTVGANYWFTEVEKGFFAGARIGYNSSGLSGTYHDGSYTHVNSTQYAIVLPIEVGYSFAASNKLWALSPYIGLDLNYVVGGKSKTKDYNVDHEVKIKKDFYPYLKVGGRLRLYSFNIGGAYNYSLKENMFGQKESYFSINIGYGF